MRTTLDPATGYVVLINTFTVEPERADALLVCLSRASAEAFRSMPGFVSANLHMSQDKRHVANYAQWRTQDDVDAMLADPQIQSHMKEAADIATSYEPVFCQRRPKSDPVAAGES